MSKLEKLIEELGEMKDRYVVAATSKDGFAMLDYIPIQSFVEALNELRVFKERMENDLVELSAHKANKEKSEGR